MDVIKLSMLCFLEEAPTKELVSPEKLNVTCPSSNQQLVSVDVEDDEDHGSGYLSLKTDNDVLAYLEDRCLGWRSHCLVPSAWPTLITESNASVSVIGLACSASELDKVMVECCNVDICQTHSNVTLYL